MSQKYTKLAEDIVFSSLWAKDGDTCKLWVTLIAIKDRDGIVDKNISGISRLAGIPIEKCKEAFDLFMAPDPESTSTEFEGRKLIPLPEGGWRVVTHLKYEEYGWSDEKKQYERERKAKFRAMQKQLPSEGMQVAIEGLDPKPPKPKFIPPTIEECKARAKSIGMNESEGEKFFHFYESKGWKVGKDVMKAWRSSMSGWKLRNNQQPDLIKATPSSNQKLTKEEELKIIADCC